MAVDIENEKALTVVPQSSVTISKKDLDIYREHFCKGATPAEWLIFTQKCALYGLNPMLNEIYLVKRFFQGKEVYTTQVSITGLITLAERTSRYEGTTRVVYYDAELNEYPVWPISRGPYPYAVSIGVYKTGHREPYVATLCFHERAAYKDKDRKEMMPQWKSQGIHMLVKCCLAAALRWEFAEACSGVYIHEEMHMVDAEAESVRVIPDATGSTNEALAATAKGETTQMATESQLTTIHRLCGQLGREIDPESEKDLTSEKARTLITDLSKAVNERKKAESKPAEQKPATTNTDDEAVKIHALGKIAQRCDEEFGKDKGAIVYRNARAYAVKKLELGDVPDGLMPDSALTEMWNAVNGAIARQQQPVGATSGK